MLGVPVWCLNRVPLHYVQKARIILNARRGAMNHMLTGDKKPGLQPVIVVKPFG